MIRPAEEKNEELQEQILEWIGQMDTPGFFITAEFSAADTQMPVELLAFVEDKLSVIRAGSPVRKFVFREDGWRIILTFFPTDQTVDERYALKNKVFKHR